MVFGFVFINEIKGINKEIVGGEGSKILYFGLERGFNLKFLENKVVKL